MLYIKDNKIKDATNIVVIKGGFLIINPTHEQIIADGWKVYTTPQPTFEEIKRKKILEIDIFDKSKNVNEFFVDGMSAWLSREERMCVSYSTTLEKEAGQQTTTLWLNGISLNLPCDIVLGLLAQLEQYAKLCYNNTQKHKAAVNSLQTQEEVEAYNYRVDYPQKLEFSTKV